MATPVYGKQYIRFAETGLAADDAAAFSQFRVVAIDPTAGTEPPTLAYPTADGEVFGVLQQDIPALDEERAVTLPRLGTVATSGLLLIENTGGSDFTNGDALSLTNTDGSADAGGSVTPSVNGTTPIVRQTVLIGGVKMVLLSLIHI